MTWAFVLGTRPEAIKMAPVIEQARLVGQRLRIVWTGQHSTLANFIRTDERFTGYEDLLCPSDNRPLEYARQVQYRVAKWLAEANPDLVLVQGDTASAWGGAMAGEHRDIPVAHIEAGVRSGDFTQPFPEEVFRIEIDRVSSYLFFPSEQCSRNVPDNLRNDGKVYAITGNTGIDAAYRICRPIQHPEKTVDRVLVTLHRRESFGDAIRTLAAGVCTAARTHPATEFWWPTHPNPEVQKALPLPADRPSNLHLTPAWEPETFVRVLSRSRAVLTDSGGVQEEAAAFGIPCLVCRDVTDRPESVEAGLARVVGRDETKLLAGIHDALTFQFPSTPSTCFGDGKAAERIVSLLRDR